MSLPMTEARKAMRPMNHTTCNPRSRTGRSSWLAVAMLAAFLLVATAPALAGAAQPKLTVRTVISDSSKAGEPTSIALSIRNDGDAPTTGPLTLLDELPEGMTGQFADARFAQDMSTWNCADVFGQTELSCVYPGVLDPSENSPALVFYVDVSPDASGMVSNKAEVTGGGAVAAADQQPTTITDAPSEFGIDLFDGLILDRDGSATRQAGSHPYSYTTTIGFKSRTRQLLTGYPALAPIEDVKDLEVDLPPGLIGNPLATSTRCEPDLLAGVPSQTSGCPPASQVGLATIATGGLRPIWYEVPIYNLEPPPGAPAAFGFQVQRVVVQMTASLRYSDGYAVSVSSRNTTNTLPVTGAQVTFWGVPADSSHDAERAPCFWGENQGVSGDLCPVTAPRKPFLSMPTACSAEPNETTLRASSWPNRDVFVTASALHHMATPNEDQAIGLFGCERLAFAPSMSVTTSSSEPDSPTGFEFELALPQDDNPDGLSTAHLRRASVTLPEGMTISPSSAAGLQACTDEQLSVEEVGPTDCPNGSKIGTVSLETPLLEKPVAGSVHVLPQASGDPQSGDLFRIAIALRDDARGIHVKLPGRIRADAETGRLTATFDNSPQLPFSKLRMQLKSGPRAPLATPASCGTKTVNGEFSSWSGTTVSTTASFSIDCPGASGFSPAFTAGAVSPTGGQFSPFVARIEREDGEEYLSGVEVELPPGLLAKLRGVALCPDSVAGDGTPGECPQASRVGTATVAAGTGSPFHLQGGVYLTGPYKGAPFGLSVQVHAKAGPYDLGWVKVRQQLRIDPDDAHVTVVSDRLPTIVKGVPIRLRSIHVDVDRPGFTMTPTSCAEKRIAGMLSSTAGSRVQVGTRFQVGDCQALAFRPKLAMRLTGKRQRRTGGHPGIRALVKQGSGQAGIGRVEVRLPSSLALDTERAASDSLCEWRESLKEEPDCPASSIIGHAKAVTPLLNQPLQGPVYFAKRKRINRFGREISTFPSLVVALRGEVAINLRGSTTVKPGALTTTFAQVPDAPISRFALNLSGARKGILLVTKTSRGRRINLCAKRQIAEADIDGQNGKRADQRVAIKTPCARKAKRPKR
jgi:hypothetical protein